MCDGRRFQADGAATEKEMLGSLSSSNQIKSDIFATQKLEKSSM